MISSSLHPSVSISRRQMLFTTIAASLVSKKAFADDNTIAHIRAPRYLGKKNAPIEVIEFFSMTCGHCAEFHNETFPDIKTKLIKTGLVRFEKRAFPLDGIALRAHAMARSVAIEKYFPMVNMLLKNQSLWSTSPDPVDSLQKLGRIAGIGSAEFNSIMRNRPLLESIVEMRQQAAMKWQLRATPSFVINQKTVISGMLSYDEFAEKINATST